MCLTEPIHELYCVEHLGASEENMKVPVCCNAQTEPRSSGSKCGVPAPLRPDPSNQGKPGRKVRKGLGTDRVAAERLVAELNGLLADPTLHSPAARAKAEEIFKDPRIIEIFYDGIEPKRENYRDLRNDHLPFPPREDGYPRILLIGVPGAGKTTLVRQLIGSHPVHDRFPSTSVNRTTTFETEIIAGATRVFRRCDFHV